MRGIKVGSSYAKEHCIDGFHEKVREYCPHIESIDGEKIFVVFSICIAGEPLFGYNNS